MADGSEVFVRYVHCPGGQPLVRGQRIKFKMAPPYPPGRCPQAIDVRILPFHVCATEADGNVL
jgi:hypothetical protein